MAFAVRQNDALSRFELNIDGAIAFANCRLADGVLTFTHTETPPALRGRGVASQLVHGALEAARAQRLKVVARCDFVAGYLAKHPEFNDIIA